MAIHEGEKTRLERLSAGVPRLGADCTDFCATAFIESNTEAQTKKEVQK